MGNIWDFIYQDRVRITDHDGDAFIGSVISIDDPEEDEDGEATEDTLSLELEDGRIIEFLTSEIASIGYSEDSNGQR